ncbi:hypothetical protein MTR_8g006740 [Medicago truncatula]|uniref:Uncharacterized protein n=1 Tax=Medicago truncatula TaxID=3880 RepID=A0A072TKV7_MEDTR|nr:hypothetical protein MTR_8g006740 [Medicago truncatula]
MRHPYTFTKRICYKVDWLFEDLTAIFLRAAAIELHTNDRKMIPYIIGEILIYVSSKMSSKYGGKKMSHLGGCWWDYENLGLDKDVTLEKMKQVLRSEFEEKNVIKVWEDLPPIEVYSNPGYFETRASPESYVALFSEDMINKRLLRYLGTLGYNIVLISRDRKKSTTK